MTEYILSIDPGLSSGVALLSYTDDTTPKLVKAWQFKGGADALNTWIDDHFDMDGWDPHNDEPNRRGMCLWKQRVQAFLDESHERYDPDLDDYVTDPPNLTIIAEKFNARNAVGFSYTTASLEPLRCEGVLVGTGLGEFVKYVQPPQQYIAGGGGKADKKKRQHRLLKDLGFYVTGKGLDAPDADDARSAIAHALGYLVRSGHKPTYEMIAGWAGELDG